jgi:hypothetical protein
LCGEPVSVCPREGGRLFWELEDSFGEALVGSSEGKRMGGRASSGDGKSLPFVHIARIIMCSRIDAKAQELAGRLGSAYGELIVISDAQGWPLSSRDILNNVNG